MLTIHQAVQINTQNTGTICSIHRFCSLQWKRKECKTANIGIWHITV